MFATGTYLTDGYRLFYVITSDDRDPRSVVLLEDCHTLSHHPFTTRELSTMRLWRVPRPGAGPGASVSEARSRARAR